MLTIQSVSEVLVIWVEDFNHCVRVLLLKFKVKRKGNLHQRPCRGQPQTLDTPLLEIKKVVVGSLRKLALFAGRDSAHFPTSRNWSHLDSFQTLASRSEPVFGRGQVPVSASFFSAEATCGEALGQFLRPFGRLTELCWNYQFNVNFYLPIVHDVGYLIVDFGLIRICHLLHSVFSE